MIYFAVSFALGIFFEKYFGFGWTSGVLILLVSIIFALAPEGHPQNVQVPEGDPLRARKILLIGLAFAIGILRMSFADFSPDQNLYSSIGQKVSFEAVVSDEPDVRDASARYTVRPTDSQSLVLLVADRFPQFRYGDQIKVSGRLDKPKNFTSGNGVEFDYISYLSKDRIHFLIYRPQIEKLEDNKGNKIVAALYSLKNIFIEKISAVVPEPNSSLLSGMIFGSKQSLGEKLLQDFQKAGLIHIVVLSGYNITIIAAGIFYAASYFGKRKLSFILTAVSVVLFGVMVGLGATVIRAIIMALIAMLARFLGRPSDALRWLFIAGILMLLWNPLILFYDPSFQLSFMATLGLILFSPFVFSFIINSKLQKFIPAKFGIREIVASTLAVQFFVLPLLIKMSGFVSIISFFINPLVLPLVPFAMASGALTGALGLVPFLGYFLSWPLGALSYILSLTIISLTELSASLPLATLQTGSISFLMILVWYGAYGFLYYKLTSPPPTGVGVPLS